jgi:hypothetical protein
MSYLSIARVPAIKPLTAWQQPGRGSGGTTRCPEAANGVQRDAFFWLSEGFARDSIITVGYAMSLIIEEEVV